MRPVTNFQPILNLNLGIDSLNRKATNLEIVFQNKKYLPKMLTNTRKIKATLIGNLYNL